MLNDLVDLLDLPDSDYWYDVACCLARSILDKDGHYLLPQLLVEWSAWPEMRKNHLAYILGEGASPIERTILEAMEKSGNSDFAFTARESLRSNYSKDA
jgi:hypothetical protein